MAGRWTFVLVIALACAMVTAQPLELAELDEGVEMPLVVIYGEVNTQSDGSLEVVPMSTEVDAEESLEEVARTKTAGKIQNSGITSFRSGNKRIPLRCNVVVVDSLGDCHLVPYLKGYEDRIVNVITFGLGLGAKDMFSGGQNGYVREQMRFMQNVQAKTRAGAFLYAIHPTSTKEAAGSPAGWTTFLKKVKTDPVYYWYYYLDSKKIDETSQRDFVQNLLDAYRYLQKESVPFKEFEPTAIKFFKQLKPKSGQFDKLNKREFLDYFGKAGRRLLSEQTDVQV